MTLRFVRAVGPRRLIAALAAFILGHHRSLAEDGERVTAIIQPPPRFEGLEFVPARDPFLLVANHFQAPGLWIGWVAVAIANAVAQVRVPGGEELHWVVTSEWRWFELGGHWVPNPATSLLFPRASKVWGMVSTPARPTDLAGRARALRQILRYLGSYRSGSPGIPQPVGLFPEGKATVALEEAVPGTGVFLHHVSSRGTPLLPVGVYHDARTLVIRFGQPFEITVPRTSGQEALDKLARQQVMASIGRLIPQDLWGAYADVIGEPC